MSVMDVREFFVEGDGFTSKLRLPSGTYIDAFFDSDYTDASGVSTNAPAVNVLSEDIVGIARNDIVQLGLVDYRVHTIEDDNGGTTTLRLHKV